jgi:hypothetical protein
MMMFDVLLQNCTEMIEADYQTMKKPIHEELAHPVPKEYLRLLAN